MYMLFVHVEFYALVPFIFWVSFVGQQRASECYKNHRPVESGSIEKGGVVIQHILLCSLFASGRKQTPRLQSSQRTQQRASECYKNHRPVESGSIEKGGVVIQHILLCSLLASGRKQKPRLLSSQGTLQHLGQTAGERARAPCKRRQEGQAVSRQAGH